jgi:hypothetical protein
MVRQRSRVPFSKRKETRMRKLLFGALALTGLLMTAPNVEAAHHGIVGGSRFGFGNRFGFGTNFGFANRFGFGNRFFNPFFSRGFINQPIFPCGGFGSNFGFNPFGMAFGIGNGFANFGSFGGCVSPSFLGTGSALNFGTYGGATSAFGFNSLGAADDLILQQFLTGQGISTDPTCMGFFRRQFLIDPGFASRVRGFRGGFHGLGILGGLSRILGFPFGLLGGFGGFNRGFGLGVGRTGLGNGLLAKRGTAAPARGARAAKPALRTAPRVAAPKRK